MLSCWSMIAAPIAAKLMTSAMICRCFDCRKRSSASVALTPFSFFTLTSGSASIFSRVMMNVTSAALSAIRTAPGRIRLIDPIRLADAASAEPAMPPNGAPPPMNPKSRLA
jgi:hypothetical protein